MLVIRTLFYNLRTVLEKGAPERKFQRNNETCEVTAVHVGDRRSIKLADSIEELLMTMKGLW